MQKKGFPEQLSLMIITLIIIASLLISWLVITNFSNFFIKKQGIRSLTTDFELSQIKATDLNNISFSLKRVPGNSNISGFYIVFKDSTNNQAIVNKFNSTRLNENEEMLIFIQEKDFDAQLAGEIIEIGIYPTNLFKEEQESSSQQTFQVGGNQGEGSSSHGRSEKGSDGGNSGSPTNFTPQQTPQELKAFPEAEGFGAYTVGGRGGKIIYVNTTKDYGTGRYSTKENVIPGSLRWAIENQTGPRIILFKVGGTIHLKDSLLLDGEKGSYITIAGQTAPGDGILVADGDFELRNAHDVIMRHIRTKQSLNFNLSLDANKQVTQANWYDFTYKGILIYSKSGYSYNLIFDHCSFEWGLDDMWGGGGRNITVQWSILGEGSIYGDAITAGSFLGNTSWSRGGQPSQGLVIGENPSYFCQTNNCPSTSLHHNLFIHNSARNPMIYTNGSRVDVINNLVYNYGLAMPVSADSGSTETSKANFIGNKFIRGPDWLKDQGHAISLHEYVNWTQSNGEIYYIPAPTPNSIYVEDNLDDKSRKYENQSEWDITAWVHWPGYPDENISINCTWVRDAEGKILYNRCGYFTVPLSEIYRRLTRFPSQGVPITINRASELESVLCPAVGATKPKRDATDERLINELATRTGHYGIGANQQPPQWDANGKLISSGHDPIPELSSGTPAADTDNDGMPDDWETSHNLNPNSPTDGNQDQDSDGYTNIEEYLNSIA